MIVAKVSENWSGGKILLIQRERHMSGGKRTDEKGGGVLNQRKRTWGFWSGCLVQCWVAGTAVNEQLKTLTGGVRGN